MSPMPSPLKSPVPATDQEVETFPMPIDEDTVGPFMNQIATLPLLSRQRMSVLPSPSKSPVPTIAQLALGAAPRPADCSSVAPFISHTATLLPLASYQRMSAKPSPLKSPVPATDQA